MFFVYILASKPNGTLYIGVTRDLIRRVHEHKMKAVPGFTAKYGITHSANKNLWINSRFGNLRDICLWFSIGFLILLSKVGKIIVI